MTYSSNKVFNRLIKDLIKDDWRFVRRRKHGMLIAPNGRKLSVSRSPSDQRAFHSLKADIRRALL
jgi:hypothetical protein